MCTPSLPQAGPSYWQSGAPGMNPDEISALPQYDIGDVGGSITAIAEKKRERDAAINTWIDKNPERYQEALRLEREGPKPEPGQQAARTARKGAGGGGGGGSSSAGTLLTAGATTGVNPSDLDLSKNTLLGL